jgi:branched-chain amino acid transport system ATP-binding protein
MLVVDHIEAGYPSVEVLHGVGFDLQLNEIVSLLGANGAGKTTTVKALSGLIPVKSGRILFEGRDITHMAPHRRVAAGVVQVPEGRKVFSSLTVLENLELGAYLPEPKKKRQASLKRVYDMFPILRERTHQAAGTLSGGEQQMLALGRGVMALPRILILDEPSLGLAPLVVEEILAAIKEINREGVAILLVEQNVHQALGISNRAFVLEEGAISIQGKGSELLADDRIRRVYLGIEEVQGA